MIGPNYRFENELKTYVNERIPIYKNVPSLIEFFSHYDLAITGGGVTCCEANASGLPCLIIANAQHEINTGRHLEALGGCVYAGDYSEWDSSIIGRLQELDINKMSNKGMKIFDTKALERIFCYIIESI